MELIGIKFWCLQLHLIATVFVRTQISVAQVYCNGWHAQAQLGRELFAWRSALPDLDPPGICTQCEIKFCWIVILISPRIAWSRSAGFLRSPPPPLHHSTQTDPGAHRAISTQWVPGAFSLCVKRQEHEANHSLPSSVEVKVACSLIKQRETFPLTSLLRLSSRLHCARAEVPQAQGHI